MMCLTSHTGQRLLVKVPTDIFWPVTAKLLMGLDCNQGQWPWLPQHQAFQCRKVKGQFRIQLHIPLNVLKYLCLVFIVLTYIVFNGMVEKPLVSAFQNFLWLENQLYIKKVMGRNVLMCFVSTALTYIALNALEILMPYVDSVDIYSIECIRNTYALC